MYDCIVPEEMAVVKLYAYDLRAFLVRRCCMSTLEACSACTQSQASFSGYCRRRRGHTVLLLLQTECICVYRAHEGWDVVCDKADPGRPPSRNLT